MFAPLLVLELFIAACIQTLVTGRVQNIQNLPDTTQRLVEIDGAQYVDHISSVSMDKLVTVGMCATCYSQGDDAQPKCRPAIGCSDNVESITGDAICKERYNLTFDKIVGNILYCKNTTIQKVESYDGIKVVLPN